MMMQKMRPDWLKVRFPGGRDFAEIKSILRLHRLHTVCEEAVCPNIGECFNSRTATFLVLGDVCTRNCGFCAVKKGRPSDPDPTEPKRIADAVMEIGLRYVVVTSVTRDDLPDGGARHYAETIREIKRSDPNCLIEVLIPDFLGSYEALRVVVDEGPDVLNHNLETVPRLYYRVRPMANYLRSLRVLEMAKMLASHITTKSGLIMGLGEGLDEIMGVMGDLRAVGCDVLTMGQYISPGDQSLPVARYYAPEDFDDLKFKAEQIGFRHVTSAPLVRSSYHASSLHNITL